MKCHWNSIYVSEELSRDSKIRILKAFTTFYAISQLFDFPTTRLPSDLESRRCRTAAIAPDFVVTNPRMSLGPAMQSMQQSLHCWIHQELLGIHYLNDTSASNGQSSKSAQVHELHRCGIPCNGTDNIRTLAHCEKCLLSFQACMHPKQVASKELNRKV